MNAGVIRVSEAEFQRALLIVLSAIPGVRVWRQNTGVVPVRDRNGVAERVFRAGPPKGAADITGIVEPCGWRLEVEVKSALGRVSREQSAWGAMIERMGGIHMVAKIEDGERPGDAAGRVARELGALIGSRRVSR